MPTFLTHRHLACVLLIGAVCGCGGGGPEVVDVDGSVRYQGEPLQGATVTFLHQGESAGTLAIGTTDAQGRFQVRTMISPTETYEGALPGPHRVTISKFVPPGNMTEEEYQRRAALEEQASESQPYGSLTEDQLLPPKVQLLPPEYSDSQRTTLSVEVSRANREVQFDLE